MKLHSIVPSHKYIKDCIFISHTRIFNEKEIIFWNIKDYLLIGRNVYHDQIVNFYEFVGKNK